MRSLKKNRDFKRVYTRGRSNANHYLVVYYFPNNLDINRIGFSISKKVGKAVVRNKLRRRLKEIFRLNNEIKNGFDLIVIARKPVINLNYQQLEQNVIYLLKKAGIWQ